MPLGLQGLSAPGCLSQDTEACAPGSLSAAIPKPGRLTLPLQDLLSPGCPRQDTSAYLPEGLSSPMRHVCLAVERSNCRSVCLSVCQYYCLSVCWYVASSVGRSPRRSECLRLSVGMYVCLPACLPDGLSACLPLRRTVGLSACLPMLLLVCLSPRRSVGRSLRRSVCLNLSVGPSVCLRACPSACRPVARVESLWLFLRRRPPRTRADPHKDLQPLGRLRPPQGPAACPCR